MITQTACRAAVLVVMGGLAAGCSETGFQDFFGAGKYAPDETQVSTNQPLAVPPDLQLRPPSEEAPQAVASQDAQATYQPQDLATAPGSDEGPSPSAEPYQQAQPQPQPAQPQPVQPQQQASAEAEQDVYARWGISRYHPDGREKTQVELNAEMRQKKLERERQKDPNYGTIFNMGSIWSDG